MAKTQYTITKSLRKKYKAIISFVEEAYNMNIVALRMSLKGNYILVGDLEEICINKQTVSTDVKKLFNVITCPKTDITDVESIENKKPIEIILTLSMQNNFQLLLNYMQQHFSPQPISVIQKIFYDNRDTITCYGMRDSISLSKSALQKDNSMFETLFNLLMDETRRDDKNELICVSYLFEHGKDIIALIEPKYMSFIGMHIKKLTYENHELKLSYTFCSHSFKAKINQKELAALMSNEHVKDDIASILINEIDKKMLGYRDKYNHYTKLFAKDNESYLILQYLNKMINQHFDVLLVIEYHHISFVYENCMYKAEYHILEKLNPLIYSIQKEEIYNGYYNYDIVINNDKEMNQFINMTLSELSCIPFIQESYDKSTLSAFDLTYNQMVDPLINGLYKQDNDKPKYKLLNDLEVIYDKNIYGVCCNGEIVMNHEIEIILNDYLQQAYVEAKSYLYSLFHELNIDLKMMSYIEGKGLLYGKTMICYGDMLLQQTYVLDGGMLQRGL
ncbi:MAG: hypothetical protein LUG60_10790 [Erysipelotrichaceae bacterium]|nr:hypothetical protein [Erysipelotrichaceae bacterium]